MTPADRLAAIRSDLASARWRLEQLQELLAADTSRPVGSLKPGGLPSERELRASTTKAAALVAKLEVAEKVALGAMASIGAAPGHDLKNPDPSADGRPDDGEPWIVGMARAGVEARKKMLRR